MNRKKENNNWFTSTYSYNYNFCAYLDILYIEKKYNKTSNTKSK